MPRSPQPPVPERTALYHQGFDQDYFAGDTNAEISVTGFGMLDESWSGYALNRTGFSVIPFTIPGLDSTGNTNISSDTGGAFRFWFNPAWSSQSQSGGGPGTNVTLLEMDAVNGSGAAFGWSIQVTGNGNALQVVSESGVVLQVPISWQFGQSHCMGLNYSSDATALYLDGQPVATGGGVPSVPPLVCQLTLGSTILGSDPADGDFEEFYSFGYQLDNFGMSSYYSLTGGAAALGPFTEAEMTQWTRRSGRAQTESLRSANNVFDPDTDGGGCVTGGPVYITNLVTSLDAYSNTTVSLDIQGGTNGVFYDLYATTDLTKPFPLGWSWTCQVETCNNYVLSNQPPNAAFYVVTAPQQTMVVGWGENTYGQCQPASALSNAVAVAAGDYYGMALLDDGMLVGWGDDSGGEINFPTGLSNVVSIAAGSYDGFALLADGSVAQWGCYLYGDIFFATTETGDCSQPPSSNVVAIAAGQWQGLALMNDTTVQSWGIYGVYGSDETEIPSGLSNVTAIACGWDFDVALRSDGTVVAWGENYRNETNVPPGLTNVVAIAAAGQHVLALLSNGTVEPWGYYLGPTPSGLSNVVGISAGAYDNMALLADGAVVSWGLDGVMTNIPSGISGVKAIATGLQHNLVIESGLLTPVIGVQPTNEYAITGGSATFSVACGGYPPVSFQWQFDGTNLINATNDTLTLANAQSTNQGSYSVIINTATGPITSSVAPFAIVVPPHVTSITPLIEPGTNWVASTNLGLVVDATSVDPAGFPVTYRLTLDETNVSPEVGPIFAFLGESGQTDSLSLLVSNAAGSTNISFGPATWVLAAPGMVEAWGDDFYSDCDRPIALTNVSAIAAGRYQSVAVTVAGSVVQWGCYADGDDYFSVTNFGDGSPPPSTNVVAVAAGEWQSLALMKDGTVQAWGLYGVWGTDVPDGLTGVKAIACGGHFDVALLTNGSVTAWGENYSGQTNVPAGLTNVTAIAVGIQHTLALLSNGSVQAWGDGLDGDTNVPSGLTNVASIAAGDSFSLALKTDGTVVAWGSNDSGQTNVPPGLSNVMAIAAGDHHCVALIDDGSLISWGDNTYGQTNKIFIDNGISVQSIAAGGDHTMAAIFSPQVQRSVLAQKPVNVATDLLLIYNSNSINSATVCQYYLTNRPMVSIARVLGVGCSTNDYILLSDYTNNFSGPVASWLRTNSATMPQYVILFQDLPARIEDPFNNQVCSVQYDMNSGFNAAFQQVNYGSSWHPFVTAINMNGVDGTNDCIAYINKITAMASNNPPGSLVISGLAAGYGNTNWYFDNAAYPDWGNVAVEGVFKVDTFASIYTNVDPNYTTLATNVAGYFTCGVDCIPSVFTAAFATNQAIRFFGDSGWHIMSTVDSYNGLRFPAYNVNQWTFLTWFASDAFGGTNYSNTPIGAAIHVFEPGGNEENRAIYYGDWASGKTFILSTWDSLIGNPAGSLYESAVVGDPFTVQ